MPAPRGERAGRAVTPAGVRWPAIVLCLLAGVVAGMLVPKRIVADGSTYVLMAGSLWFDRDLIYAPEDLARAQSLDAQLADRSFRLPAGLFLGKRGDEYRYAKPFVYPLVAAPLAGALGMRGFFVFNGVLASTTILCGACILVQTLGWGAALLVSGVVFMFSAAPVYMQWVDPFLLMTALVAAGVAAYRCDRPALSGVSLAAVVATRFTYLPLLAAAPILYVASGRRRDAVRFLVSASLTLAALTLLTYVLMQQWSPYLGDRYWYPDPSAVPYAGTGGGVPAIYMGKAGLANRWPLPSWHELLLGTVFALAGRASGLLLYFPTFVACALWSRRWNREKMVWLVAVAAVLLAFQMVAPHNPAGGAHALGNRFFVMLPIALLLVDRQAWRSWRLGATVFLLLPALPLLASPVESTLEPGRLMLKWPHRAFPFEWTHATMVPYPSRYPALCLFPQHCAMLGLTDAQSEWMDPGGVWIVAGARAELVLVRLQGQPPVVRLSSVAAGTRVADGSVNVPMPQRSGADVTLALSHPRAVYRDEGTGFTDLAVYELTVETPRDGEDRSTTTRAGAVFVQPLP